MNRPILTTALLTASLALAAPTLAASKASKPAKAETQAQRQPENERSEFRRSQNNNHLQLAQHIQTEDLIGVWGNATQTDEGSLLNMTMMSKNGTGADLMVFTINNPKSSLKIRQQFTWQFNEKTQTFSQRITNFSTTRDNEPSQQDKSQIGKTSTAKARMLLRDGKPDMLELTDQASGEKQSYFKQDLNKLREILKP
ncbi:hypothetical protein [Kingella oralis]|uniref:hypothetical protein n=1 Tax=Kingella oralis TaxID=505 RepID=UPI002D7EF4B8|nr:hypothetical protein [Kingella oralis]